MQKSQRLQHDNIDNQVIVKSGVFTLTEKNRIVVVNATGPVELILPTASGIDGWSCEIARIDDTLHNVVIKTTDFQKINNKDNYYINAQFMTVVFGAVNTSASATPIPGYYVRAIHEPKVVKENFTSLVDFNRDKIIYHTATSTITYAASTRPKRHGVLVQHWIESTNNANVVFPANWDVYGTFEPNKVNILTFVAFPDTAVDSDYIEATIRVL